MNVLITGEVAELVGEPLAVGEQLPHFKLEDENGDKVKTADLVGRITLISVVPDLNTDTCSLQTRHFNQTVDQFGDVQFITVSTNSVEEQRDWCAAEGVKNMRVLSDEQESFGYATNLYLPVQGFDTRAVYIVDAQGTVKYAQIIPEVSEEPDYDDALLALKTLMS
ncbi:peroxiredoxin [Leuconostoc carnosum]|uniref:thiol peroxidase n=1 Tax=Leuconostoc TaxID=1243 RepID=UPI000D5209EC|nr:MULTISPECIES: peroxiredoxin [Leuconostoc]KAA8324442.1 peroxiredoxin [Leuconostoc carnosum]KAA8358114.1 peroxiredoxin [Leuconostoc carnosum]KAA8364612.1 peroxiredoxin [Leuconostoc carnosum]KAA8365486.1 peroxiredoxin [Leuconostoc carnosum]KAA8371515.1 peroxiredoxin [Leuconostoc carnosum]